MLHALFSCHGRIGRSAMLIILPVSLLLAALGTVVWCSQFSDLEGAIKDLGWEALLPTLLDPLPHLMATIAILALLLLWWHIARALMVKRLHDRGRSGFWLIAPVLAAVAPIAMVFVPAETKAVQLGEGAAAGIALVVFVLLVRELFIMPGTPGENRYGP